MNKVVFVPVVRKGVPLHLLDKKNRKTSFPARENGFVGKIQKNSYGWLHLFSWQKSVQFVTLGNNHPVNKQYQIRDIITNEGGHLSLLLWWDNCILVITAKQPLKNKQKLSFFAAAARVGRRKQILIEATVDAIGPARVSLGLLQQPKFDGTNLQNRINGEKADLVVYSNNFLSVWGGRRQQVLMYLVLKV